MNGIGTLSFDYKILNVPEGAAANPYEVVVSGPGGSMKWTEAGSTTTTPWMSKSIGIDSSEWTVATGTFAGILSQVDALKIRVRMFSGGDPSIRVGLDNVKLAAVPEPASLAVLAVGATMILRRRKRR